MSFLPAWVCSGVQTDRAVPKEPTMIQMKDLESQPIEQSATGSFWSRLFRCFFPRIKKGRTNPVEYCPRAIEPASNTMAYHSNWQAQVSNGNEANSNATNDDSELETRKSLSLGTIILSRTSTADEANSATTIVEGKNTATRYVFTASADSSEIATVHETRESTEHLQAIVSTPKVHIRTSRDSVGLRELLEAESPGLGPSHKTTHNGWEELISQWRMEDDNDRRQNASEGHEYLAAEIGSRHSVASEITAPTSNDVEMTSGGQPDVWADTFGGPRALKGPSATERLKARYSRPRPFFHETESAWLAASPNQFLDPEVEEQFRPARAGWKRY